MTLDLLMKSGEIESIAEDMEEKMTGEDDSGCTDANPSAVEKTSDKPNTFYRLCIMNRTNKKCNMRAIQRYVEEQYVEKIQPARLAQMGRHFTRINC